MIQGPFVGPRRIGQGLEALLQVQYTQTAHLYIKLLFKIVLYKITIILGQELSTVYILILIEGKVLYQTSDNAECPLQLRGAPLYAPP